MAKRLLAFLGVGFLLGLGIPRAEAGTLVAVSGERSVLVWKDGEALVEGRKLLRAHADVKAITPLVSCAPIAGTGAIKTSRVDLGIFTGQLVGVTVTNGPFAGCRGAVYRDNYREE